MVWELPLSPLNRQEQGSAWSYKWERMSLGTEKGSFGWRCSGWEEEDIQGEEGGVPAPSMQEGLTPVQRQHSLGWQEVWG